MITLSDIMARLNLNLLAVSLLLLGSGCLPIQRDGTTHYLVLGFGIVSVNNTNTTLAQVSRANALGVLVSNHGVTAGYASESLVCIKTNENIVVEVQQSPFKPLNVCVPSSH